MPDGGSRAGERNRALTVVESRGTAHSSLVRELVLSGHGVSLVVVDTTGSEVPMGTLRWEKEPASRDEERRRELETCEKQHRDEIVGVLTHSERALAEGVLLGPPLVPLTPEPVRRIVGNLSELCAVLLALGFPATK